MYSPALPVQKKPDKIQKRQGDVTVGVAPSNDLAGDVTVGVAASAVLGRSYWRCPWPTIDCDVTAGVASMEECAEREVLFSNIIVHSCP